MACLKEEFKSRTKINKFNIKEEFMFLGYDQKYSKAKKEFTFVLATKNLIKFIKEFAVFQKKLVSTVDVKTVLFVIDLNLFLNNTCTILTNQR